MNPALLVTTTATNANKGSKLSEWERTIYFSHYTPKPRPEYAVAVTLKLDNYVSAEPSVIDDAIDIRFRNEEGLNELNNLIRRLVKARDKLEHSIKGEENG